MNFRTEPLHKTSKKPIKTNPFKSTKTLNIMTTHKEKEEIEDFIFNHALENAISFGGKANPKPILGKTISKFPFITYNLLLK